MTRGAAPQLFGQLRRDQHFLGAALQLCELLIATHLSFS